MLDSLGGTATCNLAVWIHAAWLCLTRLDSVVFGPVLIADSSTLFTLCCPLFRGIALVALPRSVSHGAFGAHALACTPARLLLAGLMRSLRPRGDVWFDIGAQFCLSYARRFPTSSL